jgi:hypothetical protein
MAKKYSVRNKAKREVGTSMSAPDKMHLLFTVVNRNKTEFYIDLLGNFEVNLQMVLNAHGTAGEKHLELLGLTDSDRAVIISAIRRDRVKDALGALEEKFRTVKGGKGVAFTVPIKSTIGVAIYQFLSNKK